jgi:hypothetical protein
MATPFEDFPQITELLDSFGEVSDANGFEKSLRGFAEAAADTLPPSERAKLDLAKILGVSNASKTRLVYEVFDLMDKDDRIRLVERLNDPRFISQGSSMEWVTERDGTTHLYYCYGAHTRDTVYDSWLRQEKGLDDSVKGFHETSEVTAPPKSEGRTSQMRAWFQRQVSRLRTRPRLS